MSHQHLTEEVECRNDLLDWRNTREEIYSKLEQTSTEAERVLLLSMYTALMDAVEQQFDFTESEDFQQARQHDYNLFIIKECLVGEVVCTETLFEVTRREIKAGRMEAANSLAEGAVGAMVEPHLSHQELLAIEEKRQAELKIAAWRKALSAFFFRKNSHY